MRFIELAFKSIYLSLRGDRQTVATLKWISSNQSVRKPGFPLSRRGSINAH